MLKNLKGSPLSVFRHCETLARHSVHFFEYVIFSKIFFSKKFQFSNTVKEYLTLGSLFAIFEPWIWRRLGPVPACWVYRDFKTFSGKKEFSDALKNGESDFQVLWDPFMKRELKIPKNVEKN